MFESLFWYKVLTKEDSARIIKEFNTKMSDKSKLASCGSCGERKYDAIFKEINVKMEFDILKLNENQIQDWYTIIAKGSNQTNESRNGTGMPKLSPLSRSSRQMHIGLDMI